MFLLGRFITATGKEAETPTLQWLRREVITLDLWLCSLSQ